jgi:hypothetical protein
MRVRYKGLDHSNLANFAIDIAKTVLVSCEKWPLSMVLFLTLFPAVSVCTTAAPQQSITPSSRSQQSSSLTLSSTAVQVASPPPQRSSSCSGGAAILSVSVDSDYAAASSEPLAMLSSAGLVPGRCLRCCLWASAAKRLILELFRELTRMPNEFCDKFKQVEILIATCAAMLRRLFKRFLIPGDERFHFFFWRILASFESKGIVR